MTQGRGVGRAAHFQKYNYRHGEAKRGSAIGGDLRCVAEWAEATGMNAYTIYKRLAAGWPPAEAIYRRANFANHAIRQKEAK